MYICQPQSPSSSHRPLSLLVSICLSSASERHFFNGEENSIIETQETVLFLLFYGRLVKLTQTVPLHGQALEPLGPIGVDGGREEGGEGVYAPIP